MPSMLNAPSFRSRSRADLDLLQGAWITIAGRREARLLFAGRRFAFEFLDGDHDIYFGTFSLNPETDPRQMDMLIEEGPASHRGQVTLCVYHLDADILRWCPARPGTMARLSAFPSVDDEQYISLVLKHIRAVRRGRG